MLRRVDLVRTDVSEEPSASFIGELGTLAVTGNRGTLRKNAWKYLVFLRSVRRLLVTARVVPSSPILVTLIEALISPKRRFLQEPHGVTSQKTPFFRLQDFKNVKERSPASTRNRTPVVLPIAGSVMTGHWDMYGKETAPTSYISHSRFPKIHFPTTTLGTEWASSRSDGEERIIVDMFLLHK
jgi:hypothetical protein